MNRMTGLRATGILVMSLSGAACSGPLPPSATSRAEIETWQDRAARVEIVRDDWGVPHIYAPTDADAVFGLMYAQAEDDFNRIEMNFLTSLGRMAEAEGQARLWQDLRQRLFIDPVALQAMYDDSPQWLRHLMDGWADGLNFYLSTHPEVEPRVLTRFEPWMALSFSEGSIGGDIEQVSLRGLEELYGQSGPLLPAATEHEIMPGTRRTPGATPGLRLASGLVERDPYLEPVGSNGIAIAPERTSAGHALLLINPHTSFFFRHEAHVVSDEGLNAYGALTWGQFFIYQGFNETAGWMHTSSRVDNIDEFVETVIDDQGTPSYRYGDELRPLEAHQITLKVRRDDGGFDERVFTTYRSHHGPVTGVADDGRWVATALMEEPLRALIQSYSRTKAANLDEYLTVMESHTNSSNNTLFADAEGNIAYLHSNFVPVRSPDFDYSRPVDGSDPATDWQGVHAIEESPNSINPATGFAFCTNNWPWSASGASSPRASDFPAYMDLGEENPRGEHALELLPQQSDLTLEGLLGIAYSTRVPYFDEPIPALAADVRSLPADDGRRARLLPVVEQLEAWDRRWDVSSIETSVAVFWASELTRIDGSAGASGDAAARPELRLARIDALSAALDRLEADFGSWQTPWGEINRFQRVNGEIVQPFNDELASTPVGFTSARWGSLASFGARAWPGTRRWYGTSGNSFVAVVEFGDRLRARAVTAGGLNSDPSSPHFNDQAERYATGNLRDVRFYREDVDAHAERKYRPGGR